MLSKLILHLTRLYGCFVVWMILVSTETCIGSVTSNNNTHPEVRLQADLFVGYSSKVRPVLDPIRTIYVIVDLWLLAVVGLNEREQSISTTVWLVVNWFDELLKWNTSTYGGINTTYVSLDQIWTPDILFRNEIGNKKGIRDTDFADPFIQSNGKVIWWPGKELKTNCEIDTIKYPFDKQDCTLDIGKWYSDDNRINISTVYSTIGTQFYRQSEEWDLLGTYVKTDARLEGETYFTRILFGVKLKRRPLNFLMNVMFPLVFLSFLNQICFVLPIQSGEKIGMCMAICLTFTVFLSLVSQSLPQSSIHIPAYCVYLVFQSILSIVTISSEVFILRIYHTTCRVDSAFSKFVYFLATQFGIDAVEEKAVKRKFGIDTIEEAAHRRTFGIDATEANDNNDQFGKDVNEVDDKANGRESKEALATGVYQEVAQKLDTIVGVFLLVLNVLFTGGFFIFATS